MPKVSIHRICSDSANVAWISDVDGNSLLFPLVHYWVISDGSFVVIVARSVLLDSYVCVYIDSYEEMLYHFKSNKSHSKFNGNFTKMNLYFHTTTQTHLDSFDIVPSSHPPL